MLDWRLDTRHYSPWCLAVAMLAIWISCAGNDAAPPANMSELVALPTGAAGAIPVFAAEPSQADDQIDIHAALPVEIVTAFLSAEPDMVVFVPGAVPGAPGLLPRQVPPRQAEINVHIAPVTESAACAATYRVLGFTAAQEEDEPMVLSGNRVELTVDQIDRLASGPVSLCLEVLTNFDGTVLVSELTVETVAPRALDAEPGADQNESASDDVDGSRPKGKGQ